MMFIFNGVIFVSQMFLIIFEFYRMILPAYLQSVQNDTVYYQKKQVQAHYSSCIEAQDIVIQV